MTLGGVVKHFSLPEFNRCCEGNDTIASAYGLLTGEPPEESLRLGWAHGALLTTFLGDTTMATVDQVRAFAKCGSARIQR